MKSILFLFVAFLTLASCKKSDQQNSEISKEIEVSYASFGSEISKENMITSKEMFQEFSNLKNGDTINVKFSSTINDLCSKKGCWMKLPLTEKTETMVRFKDYGFFMPLDAKGKEVVVNGKAFVKETSVAELQHYAEDAGKTKKEIAEITEPKIEFAFEADGVLLKQ